MSDEIKKAEGAANDGTENASLKFHDSFWQWVLRFFKGALIGTGAILPGVSGGVLSIVFGIYERMMSFLANITRDFKRNMLFFIPVGLGFLASFVLLSKAIGEVLQSETLAPVFIWLFIGAIAGTLPFLFKEAKDSGRSKYHWAIMAVSAAFAFIFMLFMKDVETVNPPSGENITFFTWLFCGVVMSLGAVLPGMSPSSILIYTNLYGPMSEEIGKLNVSMLIPFAIGVVLTIGLSSKLVHWMFKRFRSGMYHIILGVVLASTIMIIPIPHYTTITENIVFSGYTVFSTVFSFIAFAGGAVGTFLLGKLEDKVKNE